jgi:hypothetical protein
MLGELIQATRRRWPAESSTSLRAAADDDDDDDDGNPTGPPMTTTDKRCDSELDGGCEKRRLQDPSRPRCANRNDTDSS